VLVYPTLTRHVVLARVEKPQAILVVAWFLVVKFHYLAPTTTLKVEKIHVTGRFVHLGAYTLTWLFALAKAEAKINTSVTG